MVRENPLEKIRWRKSYIYGENPLQFFFFLHFQATVSLDWESVHLITPCMAIIADTNGKSGCALSIVLWSHLELKIPNENVLCCYISLAIKSKSFVLHCQNLKTSIKYCEDHLHPLMYRIRTSGG